MTEKVKAEIELREAMAAAEAGSRAKSEFLAMMSHELRTPLHSIIGFAELICDDTPGSAAPQSVAYARDIRDSGRRLLRLINDVLELATLDLGDYKIREERVPLAAVVASCFGMLEGAAQQRQVVLQSDPALDDVVLWVDRRALKQICLNLIDNAVKFSEPGGAVTVAAHAAEDGDVTITVTDTGIGIEPDSLKRIFEPFCQADARPCRSHNGAGIGLAICRRLLALHDGAIELQNEPGRGTRAAVTFPRARVVKRAVWESLSRVAGEAG